MACISLPSLAGQGHMESRWARDESPWPLASRPLATAALASRSTVAKLCPPAITVKPCRPPTVAGRARRVKPRSLTKMIVIIPSRVFPQSVRGCAVACGAVACVCRACCAVCACLGMCVYRWPTRRHLPPRRWVGGSWSGGAPDRHPDVFIAGYEPLEWVSNASYMGPNATLWQAAWLQTIWQRPAQAHRQQWLPRYFTNAKLDPAVHHAPLTVRTPRDARIVISTGARPKCLARSPSASRYGRSPSRLMA